MAFDISFFSLLRQYNFKSCSHLLLQSMDHGEIEVPALKHYKTNFLTVSPKLFSSSISGDLIEGILLKN